MSVRSRDLIGRLYERVFPLTFRARCAAFDERGPIYQKLHRMRDTDKKHNAKRKSLLTTIPSQTVKCS